MFENTRVRASALRRTGAKQVRSMRPMRIAAATLGCGIFLALSGCGAGTADTLGSGSSGRSALDPVAASRALTAFNKAFYMGTPTSGYYRDATTGSFADFWREAEMIETVEDFYRLSGDQAYKRLAVALINGVVARYGSDWQRLYAFQTHRFTHPRANDDVMWMVMAFTRAYEITGDRSYLEMARRNFDLSYARASSVTFGGGLWWRSAHDRPGKNTTTNGPAVIAACELYRALHDRSYRAKAISVYAWMRAHLYDAQTGQVFDSVDWSAAHTPSVSRLKFTYNNGTFIGAAAELYKITGGRAYYNDAFRALGYARHAMTAGGILQDDSAGADQDPGGYKGILARWAIWFTRANHITAFDSWFRLNAATAWSHRNAAGLVGFDWSTQTGNGPLYAWDCSSAVAMMEAVFPASAR